MIRINLLGEPDLGPQSAKLWVGGFCLSLIVLAGVCFFLLNMTSSERAELEARQEAKEKQLTELKQKTAEVAGLEQKREQLNKRISLIARLKKNKRGPVRVLDDLNVSIPDFVWIDSVTEKEERLSMVGYSLDNQTVAKFMRELEKSEYFKAVDLIESSQAMREGVRINRFTLQAKISYAGALLDGEAGA